MSSQLSEIVGSSSHRTFILISLALASALPTINLTVANAVLPQMQGDLSASLEEVSWVLTAALVSTAIGVPTSSWFSLRFGRRRSLLVALASFTVASLMFTFASTLSEVIVWRTVQGLTGGPIPSLCMAALLDTHPKRLHAMALAFWSGGTMLGPILGPPIGSVMTQIYDWRLAFSFLAPLGILAFILIFFALSEAKKFASLRLDWIGLVSLCLGVAGLQIMLDRGNRLHWFESGEIIAWGLIALASIYVFIVQSITTRQPFIDLRIFLDKNYLIGCICMAVSGALTFVPLMLLPNLLAELRDLPIEIVGFMVMPRGIGYAISAFGLAKLIDFIDGRVVLAMGFLIQALGFWHLMSFDLSVGPMEIFLGGLILGFGEGVMWTPMAAITFLTLNPTLRSYGAAIFQFGRFFSSGLCISIAVALLSYSTQTSRAYLIEKVSLFEETSRSHLHIPLWNSSTLPGLVRLETEVFRQATMTGYLNDFFALLLLALIVVPLILLLDDPKRMD